MVEPLWRPVMSLAREIYLRALPAKPAAQQYTPNNINGSSHV